MDKATLIENLNHPISRFELISRYCRGRDVLDIGCVNHNIGNTEKNHWLHQKIREVAASCMGLDLLEEEVRELQNKGYNVIYADITHPVDIKERFDVIVVGNLIEHLSNFDGLFMNIERLLKPEGFVLVSTANPFFSEQYFYSAFKNDIIINPQHTCWIDPVALDQLARRFHFITEKVYWIEEKWHLKQVICHGERKQFDVLTGTWTFIGRHGLVERAMRPLLFIIFMILQPKRFKEISMRCDENYIKSLLYIRFMSTIFNLFWQLYKIFLVRSPLNEHELFVSILRR